jgi:ribose-phosphate pyrophosphokinase
LNTKCFRLFGLEGSLGFARRVADHLGMKLSVVDEHYWDDGEPDIHSLVNVRDCDCYVVASLFTDRRESINDKLVKAMFLGGSLFDASADRVTLVLPYIGYQRQDRKNESRVGVYPKYLAKMMTAVHIDRLLVMDPHNPAALDNAVQDMRVDKLEAKNFLADAIVRDIIDDNVNPEDLCFLSPDAGGTKRAERGRNAVAYRLAGRYPDLFIDLGHIDKKRIKKVVKAEKITTDVTGKKVILWDDMIATGGSLVKAKAVIEAHGGELWGVAATHGLFVGEKVVNQHMDQMPRIYITDTVDPWRLTPQNLSKVKTVDTTKLFADAISRIHSDGGSISELIECP